MKAFVSLAIAIAMPCALVQPAAAQATWDGYRLGAEDQIEVSIYGQGGSVTKTRIKSDGSITLPLVGRVEAANRTSQALASAIQEQLRRGGYVNDPIVNVEIVDYASRTVTVPPPRSVKMSSSSSEIATQSAGSASPGAGATLGEAGAGTGVAGVAAWSRPARSRIDMAANLPERLSLRNRLARRAIGL